MKDIRALYEKHMTEITQLVNEFPWQDKEAYAEWLAQTYHYVKYSTRLLTLAATRTPLENLPLHNRFIDHSKEERSHEVLCVNDLKAMGKDIKDFEEHFTAASMYQGQFFWITYQNPLAFFGYILFLEGIGSRHCATMYKQATAAHGAKAGVFLRVHSDEDQDHIVKAFGEIDKFSDDVKELVIQNFEQTSVMYCMLLREAMRVAQGRSKKSAA